MQFPLSFNFSVVAPGAMMKEAATAARLARAWLTARGTHVLRRRESTCGPVPSRLQPLHVPPFRLQRFCLRTTYRRQTSSAGLRLHCFPLHLCGRNRCGCRKEKKVATANKAMRGRALAKEWDAVRAWRALGHDQSSGSQAGLSSPGLTDVRGSNFRSLSAPNTQRRPNT